VPRNRGLTVEAAPADTDYTIRLENPGTGLEPRPTARQPGTDRPRHRRLTWPSPGSITQIRNRSALAPGLVRIG
jgi:hypothetical protein